VPVALTIVIFFNAIRGIDGLLPFHIPIKLSNDYTFELPGLGILSIMLGVTILGYITTRFVRNPVLYYIDNFFESTPLLKIVYSSIKDLIAAFVGEKKRFNHPVLVMVDKEAQVQRIGFVTQDDLSFLGIPHGKVAVYLPFSYGFNGQLVIVPAANISPINASGTEMMKFVISGGVTDVENN
jgi:uncharacterized membrane protein